MSLIHIQRCFSFSITILGEQLLRDSLVWLDQWEGSSKNEVNTPFFSLICSLSKHSNNLVVSELFYSLRFRPAWGSLVTVSRAINLLGMITSRLASPLAQKTLVTVTPQICGNRNRKHCAFVLFYENWKKKTKLFLPPHLPRFTPARQATRDLKQELDSYPITRQKENPNLKTHWESFTVTCVVLHHAIATRNSEKLNSEFWIKERDRLRYNIYSWKREVWYIITFEM